MRKFETHDGKKIIIDVSPESDEVIGILEDAIPRLSYDEILGGELEKRLGSASIQSLKVSSGDDLKTLIFSLAMFNTISKPPGF